MERLLSKVDTDKIVHNARNLYEYLVGGGFADLSRTPCMVIYDQPHCAIRRYNPTGELDPTALPVLLIPPLAAPATCFDLRKGCSLVEFLVDQNRPTYLVDYGDVSTRVDSALGLEHWIDDILPTAISLVSEDAGGADVHLVGWSLGGIMAVFADAARPDLPIASIVNIGGPFDFDELSLLEPVRIAADVTGDKVAPTLIRYIGGIPGRVNTFGFMFADPIRLMQKPLFVLKMRGAPDVLAQIQAVDAMMDTMEAYPGKTVTQLYRSFIAQNQLAGGTLEVGGRTVDLADVDVPILAIAGDGDHIFGPPAAVHHLAALVPNSPSVRLETAHGGHMGVLAGLGARAGTWHYIDEFLTENDTA